MIGYSEEIPDFSFPAGNESGQRAPETFVSGGQEDVPDERVDGGARDNADPIELRVKGCHHAQVHEHEQQHRCGEHLLDERFRGLGRGNLFGGEAGLVDGVPRRFARLNLGDVALKRGHDHGQHGFPGIRLTNHQHAPSLPVAPAGREARIV